MKKKLCCILFSIALVVAMIPSMAFAETTGYGVYVLGTEITSENCSNVLGDGKVSYDDATKTLTLCGADLYMKGDPAASAMSEMAAIATEHDLTICTTKDSTIKVEGEDMYAIFVSDDAECDSTLTFTGSAKLKSDLSYEWHYSAVYADQVVNKGNVEISGGACWGILSTRSFDNYGTMNINGAGGLYSDGYVNQYDGLIEVSTVGEDGIYAVGFKQTGGDVKIALAPQAEDTIMLNALKVGYEASDADESVKSKTFEISGGTLDVSVDAAKYPEFSGHGICIKSVPASITGGKVTVSVDTKEFAAGIITEDTDLAISGGEVTVKANNPEEVEGSIGCTRVLMGKVADTDIRELEVTSLPETGGIIGNELEVTASNNFDGSSPVEYSPEDVVNGYKYMYIAPPHHWDEGVVTVKPTCTEPGTKTFTCVACKETKTEEIAATGHTSVAIAAKKATTGADGATAGSKCSVCGKVLTAPETVYKASTVKLAAASKVYTGKALKPAVTIKDSKGNAIASANYSVKYANNTKVGKATAKVIFQNNYTGEKKLTFKINPKKATVKSAVPGKKSLKVTAGTKVAATGGAKYKIAYKVKGTSTWKYKTTTNKTLTIKSLKKGKKYQVKIQAIKTVNKVTYKGAWSAVKTTNKIK